MWAAELSAAKKDAILGEFSPSSHICPRRFLHDLSIHVGHSCPEPKSIIMLLSKLTCPSRVTRPLARLPTAYAATFKYLSLPPQAPRLAAGQQHNPRRSRKMWGGGACERPGPYVLPAPQPSAGASGGKRPPGAEGPPEGKSALATPNLQRSGSSYVGSNIVLAEYGGTRVALVLAFCVYERKARRSLRRSLS